MRAYAVLCFPPITNSSPLEKRKPKLSPLLLRGKLLNSFQFFSTMSYFLILMPFLVALTTGQYISSGMYRCNWIRADGLLNLFRYSFVTIFPQPYLSKSGSIVSAKNWKIEFKIMNFNFECDELDNLLDMGCGSNGWHQAYLKRIHLLRLYFGSSTETND